MFLVSAGNVVIGFLEALLAFRKDFLGFLLSSQGLSLFLESHVVDLFLVLDLFPELPVFRNFFITLLEFVHVARVMAGLNLEPMFMLFRVDETLLESTEFSLVSSLTLCVMIFRNAFEKGEASALNSLRSSFVVDLGVALTAVDRIVASENPLGVVLEAGAIFVIL